MSTLTKFVARLNVLANQQPQRPCIKHQSRHPTPILVAAHLHKIPHVYINLKPTQKTRFFRYLSSSTIIDEQNDYNLLAKARQHVLQAVCEG